MKVGVPGVKAAPTKLSRFPQEAGFRGVGACGQKGLTRWSLRLRPPPVLRKRRLPAGSSTQPGRRIRDARRKPALLSGTPRWWL